MAMEAEYALLRSLLGDSDKAVFGDKEIELRLSGIGKVNAAVTAAQLITECRPDALVSTGVAGSIDPALKAMDVMVADRIAYHDVWCGMGCVLGQVQGYPLFFETDRNMKDKAMSLHPEGLSIKSGLQVSGDKFVEAADVPGLKALYPEAISVDMESAALAQTCHRFGIPFLSIRIISDEASESSYHDFWKDVPANSVKMLRMFLEAL